MINWHYLLPMVAYLIGSISTAIVISRVMGLADPRTVGSRNPGATNVLRYGGKTAAALTLLGDLLKGAAAVLLAHWLSGDPMIVAASGFAAFLGHLFPVYHGFQGGKGVATALGVWLAINPWVGLAIAGTWIAVAAILRYSSLAALIAAALAPLYVAYAMRAAGFVVMSVAMSALLIARHHRNIRNLIAGKESRIGQRSR
jgi:glycerol-3-phosphate acyltransferase PlsY